MSEQRQICNVSTHLQHRSPENNRDLAIKSSLGYGVCMFNLKGDTNVGTIIRTSLIMSAQEVILIERPNFDRRFSVGAQNYIPIRKIKQVPDTMDFITDMYSPICIEQGGEDLSDINWTPYITGVEKPPCFILGSEDKGIPNDFIEKCRSVPGFKKISIFQPGILRSLNVSNACSIVLYAYTSAVVKNQKSKLTI